jgi:hypothetical protein
MNSLIVPLAGDACVPLADDAGVPVPDEPDELHAAASRAVAATAAAARPRRPLCLVRNFALLVRSLAAAEGGRQRHLIVSGISRLTTGGPLGLLSS